MKLIERIISFLYYSLFIFTPLIMYSKTSELFEFNKMIFIYLITLLILFFWILKMILVKKIIFKRTVFDLPIIIFLISQIFSTIFSIDPHTSFFGYYGRFNGGLLSLFSYLVLYYGFVSNFIDKKEIVKKILTVSLITCFLVILWGLPGKFGYDLSCYLFTGQLNNSCWTDQFRPHERMFSTLGQPNWLGAYLSINFFIILFFLLRDNNFINYFFSILIFVSILFTRSRSALLAALFGLVVFFIFLFFKEKRNLFFKKVIFLILFIFLSLFVFKTGINKIDRYLSFKSLSQIFLKNKIQLREIDSKPSLPTNIKVTESLDIRKIVWQGAIELAKRYPFFGTGPETFAYAYYFVRPKEHNLTSEWDYLYNKAHNEYLNYLATTGFLGLGSYLIIIGVFIFVSIKQILNSQFSIFNKTKDSKSKISKNNNITTENNQQFLVISLFLAYISILITNFFGFSTTTINLFFYLIPAFFLVLTKKELVKKEENDINEKETSLLQQTMIILTMLIFCWFILFFVRYWLADIDYASVDYYTKVGRYDLAERSLKQALQLKYEHVYQDKLSHILANLAVFSTYQKDVGKTKDYIILARKHNLDSLKKSPYNVLYWKTQAKNQFLFYQISLDKKEIEDGIQALKIAKKLSPTDPKIPYSLAVFYNLLADEDKVNKKNWQDLSLKEITDAINLKEDFRDGYFLRAQLYEKYEQKDKAKKDLEYILEKINFNDVEAKEELKKLSN